MMDGGVQMTGLVDLHTVYTNVPANAEFLVQVMEFCFRVCVLMPKTVEMLRYV